MLRIFAGCFFLIFIITDSDAQQSNAGLIRKVIAERSNNEFRKMDATKLMVNDFHLKKKIYLWPAAGLLIAYKKLVSEQISANCAFDRSCSMYAAKAFVYRPFIGLFLTVDRLTRCHPTASHEVIPLLINYENGKVIDDPDMY